MMKWIYTLIVAITITGGRSWAWSSIDQEIAAHMAVIYDTAGTTMASALGQADEVAALSQVNIGTLLTTTDNPEKALKSYEYQARHALRRQGRHIQQLISKREQQRRIQQQCLLKKRATDTQFFAATKKRAPDNMLENIAETSAQYAACAEQARVKMRAYTVMMQESNTRKSSLQKRLRVLQSNSSFLIDNVGLISSDPSNMIRINQLIRQLD